MLSASVCKRNSSVASSIFPELGLDLQIWRISKIDESIHVVSAGISIWDNPADDDLIPATMEKDIWLDLRYTAGSEPPHAIEIKWKERELTAHLHCWEDCGVGYIETQYNTGFYYNDKILYWYLRSMGAVP